MTGSDADGGTDVDISVVLACYAERRLPSIRAALVSLRKQSLEPAKVIVAVDNNARLADLLSDEFSWINLVRNDNGRGASATRNCGVSAVETAFTAFLDDDETADPEWLRTLTRPFVDPSVVGTGGKYEPSWRTSKPGWFPDEFAWVVGGSYQGLPTVTAPIRNVWSGNMAVRTNEFRAVGGFRTDFGKRGSIPQPEDTDLCIRMAAASGGHWMYVPDAVIHHDVPADRASLGFFVRRCYAEGAGKAAMQRHLADGSAVSTEHDYVRTVFVEALRRSTGRRPSTRRQGAVMLAGLASAGVGYARGRVASVSSVSTGSAAA
ncbi:MAG: hypothetical protein QOH20_1132 [Mycobacterium sp.]|nr:hypothetical protein [Mycobacterium sp.]